MILGYCRVSTLEQNEARQVEGLSNYGVEKWYIDKASGKNTNRPQLQKLLQEAVKGDTILVWDFSRLARSTKDLLELVDMLNGKEIHLRSIKENIDSSTPSGKLMLTMIGAINEFERTNLLERQREGIEIAKREGKYKGRKEIDFPESFDQIMLNVRVKLMTNQEAMEKLGLKKNTYYKLKKEYEEIRNQNNINGQMMVEDYF